MKTPYAIALRRIGCHRHGHCAIAAKISAEVLVAAWITEC
jgi:hypothetical protein